MQLREMMYSQGLALFPQYHQEPQSTDLVLHGLSSGVYHYASWPGIIYVQMLPPGVPLFVFYMYIQPEKDS